MDEHLIDQRLDPADAGSEGDAHARRELRRDLEASRLERLTGSGDREVHEAVGAADLFPVHVLERIEVAHLAGDRRLEACGVEARDRTDPTPPRDDAVPCPLYGRPEGSDHAETRHHDTAALAVLHRSSLA